MYQFKKVDKNHEKKSETFYVKLGACALKMCIPNVALLLIDNKRRIFDVHLTTTQIVILLRDREKNANDISSTTFQTELHKYQTHF